jgi:hypothetical protein
MGRPLGDAPYIVRVSSSPSTRGTRVERGGEPTAPTARRALPEPPDAPPRTAVPSDRRTSGDTADRRFGLSLQEGDRQLLATLAMAIVVILFITVVLPMLMSLVRNF